jgi:hypothetical protein
MIVPFPMLPPLSPGEYTEPETQTPKTVCWRMAAETKESFDEWIAALQATLAHLASWNVVQTTHC